MAKKSKFQIGDRAIPREWVRNQPIFTDADRATVKHIWEEGGSYKYVVTGCTSEIPPQEIVVAEKDLLSAKEATKAGIDLLAKKCRWEINELKNQIQTRRETLEVLKEEKEKLTKKPRKN